MDSQLTRIVRAAEKGLLRAIAIAANSGDLDTIDSLRAAIRELRGVDARRDEAIRVLKADTPVGGSKSREVRPARAMAKYPHFRARRGTLYRVGWSRKTKSEYEHKVPKNTVTAIVQAMAAAAEASVDPVTVEAVVARLNRMSPVQVPQYQVYLVIGWLRHAMQIEQVGRDGYRIPRDIVRIAEENWQELLTRAG